MNWGFIVMGRTGGEKLCDLLLGSAQNGKICATKGGRRASQPGVATKDGRRASQLGAVQLRNVGAQANLGLRDGAPGSRAGFLSLTVGGRGRPEPHRVLLRFGLAVRIPLRATS